MSRSGHCRNRSTTIGSTSQPASRSSSAISRSAMDSARASFMGPAPESAQAQYTGFSGPLARPDQPTVSGTRLSPGPSLFRSRSVAPGHSVEQPVHAGPDGMDLLIGWAFLVRAGEEILIRKVQEEVFDFERQVRRCCHFDPAAGGKTGHQPTVVESPRCAVIIITIGARGNDDMRLGMGPGNPGRLVYQHTIPRVADAFAEAAEGIDCDGDRSFGAALVGIPAG